MVDGSNEAAHERNASTQPDAESLLTGSRLRQMFRDAHELLERHVGALNAINVFPVPDGDTGTNMHLTLRAAIDALEQSDTDDVSSVTAALARGALMGARGNSGVILSQVLLGLSRGLEGKAEVSGSDVASALTQASDAAYAALAEPKEGTILTVARAAADARSPSWSSPSPAMQKRTSERSRASLAAAARKTSIRLIGTSRAAIVTRNAESGTPRLRLISKRAAIRSSAERSNRSRSKPSGTTRI